MGWLTVGLLSLVLSTPGWALDLDRAIQEQNQTASEIARTLHSSPRAAKSSKKSSKIARKKGKKKIYYVQFKAPPKKRS